MYPGFALLDPHSRRVAPITAVLVPLSWRDADRLRFTVGLVGVLQQVDSLAFVSCNTTTTEKQAHIRVTTAVA